MTLYIIIIIIICLQRSQEIQAQNRCKEMVLRSLEGKALNDFVFKKVQTDENFCRSLCYMDDRCLSINYITVKQTCELSESDHVMQPSSFVSRPRSVYYRVENNCRCSSKETCRYNSALNKFQCLCNAKDPTANCNASASSTEEAAQSSLIFESTANATSTSSANTRSIEAASTPPIIIAPTSSLPSRTSAKGVISSESIYKPSPSFIIFPQSNSVSIEPSSTISSPSLSSVTHLPNAATSPTTTSSTSTSDCQLDFASVNDYAKIPSALAQPIKSFTLNFWLKVPSSYQDTLQIFSYKTDDGSSDFSLGIKSNGLAEIKINGGGQSLKSNMQRDNKWQNFVIKWSNDYGYVRLYRNGFTQQKEYGFQRKQVINAGGTIYFGQKHQSDGFDPKIALIGSVADMEMWKDSGMLAWLIYRQNCQSARKYKPGDILSWKAILNSPHNVQVSKVCPSTCQF